jgi:hypothetical protein
MARYFRSRAAIFTVGFATERRLRRIVRRDSSSSVTPPDDGTGCGRSAAQAATRRTGQTRSVSRASALARPEPGQGSIYGQARPERGGQGQGSSGVTRIERERRPQAAYGRRTRPARGAGPLRRTARSTGNRWAGPARGARWSRTRPIGSGPPRVGFEQADLTQHRRSQSDPKRHPVSAPALPQSREAARTDRAEGAPVAPPGSTRRGRCLGAGEGLGADAEICAEPAGTRSLDRGQCRVASRRGPGRVARAAGARARGGGVQRRTRA